MGDKVNGLVIMEEILVGVDHEVADGFNDLIEDCGDKSWKQGEDKELIM